jgi:lysophospholipase L1-like esterase
MSRKKNRQKTAKGEKPKTGLRNKLLLLVGTIIVVLAAAEVIVRRIYPGPQESRWSQHHFRVGALGFSDLNDIMEPDLDLFWRVKPNLKDRYVMGWVGTSTFLSFKVNTDAFGHRKMEGADRSRNILFLGDSCTFGIGVKAKETCAARTAAALKIRARNLSCPGYTLYQGRRLLERMGWDPSPAALVVGFGFNDRLVWDGLSDPEHAKILTQKNSFLARHSRLFYCMHMALEGGLKLLKKKSAKTMRRMPPEVFAAEAEALVREAEDRGIPVVFLFWPRIEWMEEPGRNHPYAEWIEKLLDKKTVSLLDLAESFRSKGGRELYLDGIHATAEGHALAAECLLLTLESLGVAR